MGTPTFYYYPDGARALETLDLSEGLQDITTTPAVRREDAIALDGSMSTVVLGPSFSIRIKLERFGAPGPSALERQLQHLANHLRRGGLCGFAIDSDKAWCGVRSGASTRGASYVATRGNAFTAWESGATLASGDEVVIETAPPECGYEVRGVSSMTGTTQINVSETLVSAYTGSALGWARQRDFYPICYMTAEDAAADPLTHDHRRNYTLDLRLMYAPALVSALLTAGGYAAVQPLGLGKATTPALGGVSGSLESLLYASASTWRKIDPGYRP